MALAMLRHLSCFWGMDKRHGRANMCLLPCMPYRPCNVCDTPGVTNITHRVLQMLHRLCYTCNTNFVASVTKGVSSQSGYVFSMVYEPRDLNGSVVLLLHKICQPIYLKIRSAISSSVLSSAEITS